MPKNSELKKQLNELPGLIAEENENIESFIAKVKSLPQGVDRWNLEEWIITTLRIDPQEIRTKSKWSREDWLKIAIKSKDAARRYRDAGNW